MKEYYLYIPGVGCDEKTFYVVEANAIKTYEKKFLKTPKLVHEFPIKRNTVVIHSIEHPNGSGRCRIETGENYMNFFICEGIMYFIEEVSRKIYMK